MRTLVAHVIVTLDGVAQFDAVADRIVQLRDTQEVLADFFAKVADEDAMLLEALQYSNEEGHHQYCNLE